MAEWSSFDLLGDTQVTEHPPLPTDDEDDALDDAVERAVSGADLQAATPPHPESCPLLFWHLQRKANDKQIARRRPHHHLQLCLCLVTKHLRAWTEWTASVRKKRSPRTATAAHI